MIRSRGEAVTLQRHFQGDIQQIWLPELGVVDRCTTCHVGLKEASLVDVSRQPFRKHPVIPHSIDQFGCAMCHRGQGPATTAEEEIGRASCRERGEIAEVEGRCKKKENGEMKGE